MGRKAKTSTVVTLADERTTLLSHHSLLSALDVDNALLCRPSPTPHGGGGAWAWLEPDSAAHFSVSALRLDLQYIGSDVFGYALSRTGNDFIALLGQAITRAKLTFLEVVRWPLLTLISI
jgi:hypothetical protein